jgi:hypothetical protein
MSGMAVGPEQRLNPEERANLAAYLDGELTENESRVIATKLSLSPTARREVESLKKAWELLEFLHRPKASLIFSERTLTSVRALESRALSWHQAAGAWLDHARKLAVCLFVAAVSLGLGFALTRYAWPDPAARLARDLSLAEHLEEYQEVNSFEFLDELAQSLDFGGNSKSDSPTASPNGAPDRLDAARQRLRTLSPRLRAELAQALSQFDLKLTPDQQRSIRDVDERISRLSAANQVHYLAVLRRYHNWLDSLPEIDRDKLQALPPDERMAHVKKLVVRHPSPRESGPDWLPFADVGGFAPLELASDFQVWQDLTLAERREIEGISGFAQRKAKLNEHGRVHKRRDLRPADFRLDDWIPKVADRVEAIRTVDPELKHAITKAETLLKAKRKLEGKDADANIPTPLLRRLAFNLYFLEHPPRPVDPERLEQFFAAMPPWVRGSLDSYPAEEARRRLTVAYRLVYPDSEFQPPPPSLLLPEEKVPAGRTSGQAQTAKQVPRAQSPAEMPKTPASRGSSPY